MPDSTPNYLSIGNDGLVTATFTGGLILPTTETTQIPVLYNKLKWVRNTTLQYIAEVSAAWFTPSSTHQLLLRALSPSTARELFISLTATDLPNVSSNISASVSGNFVEILREDGRSGFLQAGSSARSTIVAMTFTWPGGSIFSNAASMSAAAGFAVFGGLSGSVYSAAPNIIATPILNIGANAINAIAYNVAGAPVAPPAGTQVTCLVMFYG